jgi:hypothetical protein
MPGLTLALSMGIGSSAAAAISDKGCAVYREDWLKGESSNDLPVLSVNRALQDLNLGFHEVEKVVVDHLPYLEFSRFMEEVVLSCPKSLRRFLRETPHWLGERLQIKWHVADVLGLEVPVHFVPRSQASMLYVSGLCGEKGLSLMSFESPQSDFPDWAGVAHRDRSFSVWKPTVRNREALYSAYPESFDGKSKVRMNSFIASEGKVPGSFVPDLSLDGGLASLLGAGCLALNLTGSNMSAIQKLLLGENPRSSIFSEHRLKREAAARGLRFLSSSTLASQVTETLIKETVFFRGKMGPMQWQLPHPFVLNGAGEPETGADVFFSVRDVGLDSEYGRLPFFRGSLLCLDQKEFHVQFGEQFLSYLNAGRGRARIVGPRVMEAAELLDWFSASSFVRLVVDNHLILRASEAT